MTSPFVLLHSPLVPALTMVPLCQALREQGAEAVIVTLEGDASRAHVDQIQAALQAVGTDAVLIAHSGAGVLAASIPGHWLSGVILLDAMCPLRSGRRFDLFDTPADADAWRALAGQHAARLPVSLLDPLASLITDAALAEDFRDQLVPIAISLYEEEIPVAADWLAVPGLFQHWSGRYDHDAKRAAEAGFTVRHQPSGHFRLMNDAGQVAQECLAFIEHAAGSHG